MQDLSLHGGASRCLLRIREDEGRPPLADTEFLRLFAERFPWWNDRPGSLGPGELLVVARQLGLASAITASNAYPEVLAGHRRGCRVLVRTERLPDAGGSRLLDEPMTLVLEEMGEEHFVVWCPFPNGKSDLLARAPRATWELWGATGLILEPVVP